MTVQLLPLQVFAEDTLVIDDPQQIEQLVGGEAATEEEGGEEIPLAPLLPQQPMTVTKKAVYTVKFDLPGAGEDSFALLKKFIAQQKGEIVGTQSEAGRENLSAIEQKFYDYLRASVTTLAASATGGSSVFNTNEYLGYTGLKTTWTNTELGVDSIEEENYDQIGTLFGRQFDFSKIIDALLHDLPLECYWIDKTSQMYYQIYMTFTGYQDENGNVTITEVTVSSVDFAFPVTVAYAENGDVYRLSSSLYQKYTDCDSQMAAAASNTASYADTYSKLNYLKDFICGKTQYNHDAADSGNFTADATPWQIIGVFYDENGVVCEGYSKTFQQMCDKLHVLGVEDFECYTVTGVMAGGTGAGPHMWNIVTMDDGKTYIADVTNSDQGSVGQNGGMFIAPATGSVAGGYTVNVNGTEILYTYSAETLGLLPQPVLTISDTEYTAGSTESQKYTVTFETGVDGMTVEPLTVEEYGYIGQLPNLPRLGYRLIGWSLSPEMQIFWTTETDRVDENLTLYAVWEKLITTDTDLPQEGETHTVTFVPNLGDRTYYSPMEIENGGKIENDHPYDSYDVDISLGGSVLVFEGQLYKDARCTQPWNYDKDTVTSDITLYEKWNPKFRLIWMMDEYSSSWTTYNPGETVTYNDLYWYSGKDGVAISGWYFDAELTEKIEKDDVIVMDKDVTIYPKFENGYQVVFEYSIEKDDGSFEYLTHDVLVLQAGDKVPEPEIEVPAGYKWSSGWNYEGDDYTFTLWDFENDVVTDDVYLYNKLIKSTADINWSFDETTGTLTITGTGAIPYYYMDLRPEWEIYKDDITKVVIGEGITTIGGHAFYDYKNITSLEIPENAAISFGAFGYCYGLADENGFVIINNVLCAYNGSDETVVIPDSVNRIAEYVFSSNTAIKSVEIPAGISAIGSYAFFGCEALEDIYFGGTEEQWNNVVVSSYNDALDNVTVHFADEIPGGPCGNYSFWKVEDGVLTIYGEGAMFDYEHAYTSDEIANHAPWRDYGYEIETVIIEEGITYIGNDAFCGLASAKRFVVPSTVVTIGPAAFRGCMSMEELAFAENSSLKTIRTQAFWGIAQMEPGFVLTLPEGLETIEAEAFRMYIGNKIYIPASVNNIGSPLCSKYCPDAEIIISEDNEKYSVQNNAIVTYEEEIDGYALISILPVNGEYTVADNIRRIAPKAFAYTDASKVTIPDTVNFIGEGLFIESEDINGNSLKEVVIDSKIEWLMENTFKDCYSLQTVYLPGSLTEIRPGAFENCESLKEIYFDGTEKQWSEIVIGENNDRLNSATVNFTAATSGTCGENAVWAFDGETGTLTISGTGAMYDRIYDSAYHPAPWIGYSDSIREVVISNGITYIGNGSFWDCDSINSIEIPNSIISIGGSAFYNCSSLAEVTIPKGVVSIGDCAFAGCSSITEITIPVSVTYIGQSAFYDCTSLTRIIIHKGVTTISYSAFSGCNNLKNIIIPDSVTAIDGWAFSGCESLTDVYYGGSVKQWSEIIIGEENEALNNVMIHYGAFDITAADCENGTVAVDKTIVKAGETVTVTATPAEGYALKEILVNGVAIEGNTFVVPDNTANEFTVSAVFELIPVTSGTCGENAVWAFDETTGTLTISGTGPMYDYTYDNIPWAGYIDSIEKIVIEEGVTSIGTYAFNGSTAREVVLPDGLTAIGERAFYSCEYLKELVIPDSVTYIGTSAFYACQSLETLKISAGLTEIGETVFGGLLALKQLTIPEGVQFIGYGAFVWCTSITELTIPESVTAIDNFAFRYCDSVTTVRIPSNVTYIGESAFEGANEIDTVYYNGTQEMWNNIYIGPSNEPLVNADIIFNEFVEYTVNFETGVEGLTADPVSVERGGRLYELPNLVRPGYRLMGWSHFPNLIAYWTVENDRVYENITLYAIWDKVTTTATDLPGMQTMCEIKFNTGVKNLTVPSQQTLAGNRIDFLPNIQREGYRIVGWSKSATANDFWTWELDKVYNDITLYAVWEKVATTGSDLPGDERFATGWFGEYYWRLDRTSGLLTINGYEEMDEVQPGKQPWYKYRKDIRAAKLTGYVVNIPANLFSDHTNLETVSIPDTVTTMGTGIFAGCTKLHTINYNDTVYLWNTITKPQDIPANVTIQCSDGTATDGLMASGSFGYGLAWEFDKTAAQLTISGSGSMTQLASWPWQGMGNISKVVFANGIKTVNLSFLDGMDGVTIEIPSTVTKIVVGDAFFTDAQVYYDGTIEKWISIDKTQTTTHGLKSAVVYYVPEMSTMSADWPQVTMFGLNAYFTVSGRTVTIKGKGTIGSGVQTAPWGDAADTVVIESGITEIGTGALADYSAVTNVVIPATVKSIGADALPKSQQAEIYFNGTEKQWNSIKIDSTNEIDQTVDCNTVWGVNSVTVTDSAGNALSQLDIDVYDETVVSAVKVKVDGLGEYSDEIIVATTSDFVATVTETDVRGEYLVYTNGEGSAEVTFTSAEKPEIKATVKVKATQMASAVTATISKLTTDDGKYILFAGNTVTPAITWLSGAQWPEYTVSVADGSSDVYENGKLTVTEANPNGVLTITATGAGNRTLTVSVPYIVYTEKVKGITASATKLILDHLAGKAEGDITVMPSNDGACPDFDISWTTAANIVVEQTGTNSVHAWALNNEKGSVTVTFKAKDGSGKTFKATVQTGIAVQQMELIPAATNVAIGKSVKVTSYVMPDSATLKTLTWYSEDETVATVKNGTVTGKSAGTTTIWAQTTDGTDIAQSFEITVFNPANSVVLNENIKTVTIPVHSANEAVYKAIDVAVLDKAGTQDGVLQDVTVTVTPPKGVTNYDFSFDETTGTIHFNSWNTGKYTITAVTKDGTNKKATLTINVEQHVFEFEANAPKNTQNYTQGGLPVWVVKAGTTVTPQVVYNGGDKAFAPVKAAAKYTITALEYTPDDATVEDAKCLTFNTAKTNVKAVQTGEYRLAIQPVDICGQCANSFIAQEVILKVIPKTSVDFTNAWVKSSGSYIDSMSALAVPQGVTVTLTPYVGNVKATNITTAWGALEADASNTGTATFSAGKLNLKYAQPGDGYTVTYTLTDKSNPANVFQGTKTISVYKKILKTDIQLLTDIGGTPVTDPGLNLTMQSDPLMVYVPEVDGVLNNYTVTTSSAKILAVEENGFGSWALVPQGTGTATITVAINDGSGVKQTFKVKVNAMDVPVNSINVNSKTLYLESGRPVAVQFMLKSKTGADPSMQNVQWTTSDETKVTVSTPYTDTAEGFIEICPQATGKATITGTAMDGSKKTVKITVNIVEQSKAQYTQGILLTAPVNVATNGTNDTPALVWGKTMQLKATLKPSTAKNKTIAYEVVAKDTGLPVPGVTVKAGKVTVAKPSATLTPYVGTVVVRAYITDYMAANGSGYEWIEDTMEIEIKSPLDKIVLTNIDPMYPGETRQLNAELVKNPYATVDEEYPLLWTVSDKKLAEIDENGLLTIKDTAPVGKSVKVTAATQDGSGKKVTVTIKIVKYDPLASV